MSNSLSHPYTHLNGQWIRGSFHGHCDENSRCASVPLVDGVKWYHDLGVGFVTLTDHDVITDVSEMRRTYPELPILQGFEYSSRENVVFAGPGVGPLFEKPLEEALKDAGDLLTIVCHPRPHASGKDYWTLPMLESLGTWPDGIEVYNGHYGIPSAIEKGRNPLYDFFWDEILTAGHRLWGFANDDFHDPDDFDNAFNMVHVDEKSEEGIIAAAKAGRSYASTGILLESVKEEAGRITVQVDAECQGRFVGPGGEILTEDEGKRFGYQAGDEAYVRFEGEGEAGRIFLQPMFRNG